MQLRIDVARIWTVLVSHVSKLGEQRRKEGYLQDGVNLADELHADVQSSLCYYTSELKVIRHIIALSTWLTEKRIVLLIARRSMAVAAFL